MMPNGTLTRNTQCQEYWSVSHAPSVGPMIGPSMMPMPKIDCAFGALMRRIEIDHQRLRQRDQRGARRALEQAEDHQLRSGPATGRSRIEATVNVAVQVTNSRLRP